MNTTRIHQVKDPGTLRDLVRSRIRARCPELFDALHALEAHVDDGSIDACLAAVALDDEQPQDVDLALWREYAATDLNTDDDIAPWDFDDGSTYEPDEGDEPRWMYE